MNEIAHNTKTILYQVYHFLFRISESRHIIIKGLSQIMCKFHLVC
jgi:hypothetical protein